MVLGPLLRNILYYQLIDLPVPEGVTSITYADNLLLMIEARDEAELEDKEALVRVAIWIKEKNLPIRRA